MRKIAFFMAALGLMTQVHVSAQDLNEVLDAYFDVTGLEKVLEVNTMISKGKASQMGMEFPILLTQKRPGKVRMEAEIQGMKMVQAFDGENGWVIMPWTGSLEPQDMGEDETKGLKQMGDMEGDLYNWEEKGFTLTLEGEEDMEGTPVFKLKLEKEDGDIFYYYIDAENYVVLKTDAKVKVQGTEVESSTYYSNFKPVEGMIVPFSIETRMNDQVQMTITIEDYQVNEPVEDSLFTKPAPVEE